MFERKLSFTPIKYPKARAMGITKFPYREYDSNGNIIYHEESDGSWGRAERDSNGNEIYFENSDGAWCKKEYDSNGKKIYYADSFGQKINYGS